MRLSKSLAEIPSPPIPQVTQWLKAYSNQHGPPIDLCQGAPSAPPDVRLSNALSSAAREPLSAKYSTIFGLDSMRRALGAEMAMVYGEDMDIKGEDVALTAGCNLAFYATVQVVAEKGDEIILPVPWYFNHQMALQMLDIKAIPLILDSSTGFQPSVSACENLITPKTRAIALVSPNNPTGAIYPPTLLGSFFDLAKKYNIALILDETYRDFVTGGPPHELFTRDDWRGTLIHLFSFSKSYAIPGYRLGAIVAGGEVLALVRGVLDTIQISPPTLPQLALTPLLPTLRPLIIQTAESLIARHEHFYRTLSQRAGNWTIGSQGGYFAFVRHPFAGRTADDVCRGLAEQMGIAALPGSAFCTAAPGSTPTIPDEFAQNWIRIALANVDEEQLDEVVRRLLIFEQRFPSSASHP